MPLSAKVSTKHQIALPSEARRRLGIKPGDRLTVLVRDDELVLRRRPALASDRLRGIARGAYGDDPAAYLRTLRREMEAGADERDVADDHGARGSTFADRRRR
jgi:AbrB family looped-hinge helix DNA binding protein